jgi:hypothetical protein
MTGTDGSSHSIGEIVTTSILTSRDFSTPSQNDLIVSLKKCLFELHPVEFLGHISSANGIAMVDDKVLPDVLSFCVGW